MDIIRVLLRVLVVSLPLNPVCEALIDEIGFLMLVDDLPLMPITNLRCSMFVRCIHERFAVLYDGVYYLSQPCRTPFFTKMSS